ncbi:hypothetical protein TNCV_2964781 [Trichonephila clavipes]|nr:hypothetical protein TNCV_2964781 [Trichonephila clavipes]
MVLNFIFNFMAVVSSNNGCKLMAVIVELVPLKINCAEELMHVKSVEAQSPHISVVWKFEECGAISSVILIT